MIHFTAIFFVQLFFLFINLFFGSTFESCQTAPLIREAASKRLTKVFSRYDTLNQDDQYE